MKPDTKGHTLYDYVVMKCRFQNKEIYRQDIGYVCGGGVNQAQGFFWGNKNILELEVMAVQLSEYPKNPR